MIDWLTGPFAFPFMQRALVASVLVGVACAVLGCYVVLRSMAFLGDALAHAILPGVAIAYIGSLNLLFGALMAAIVVAFGISLFTRRGTIREDTAIGILFAAALSLGVVLISTIHSYATDLTHILFGDVLGVSGSDLILTLVLTVLVVGTVIVFYKEFLIVSFDPLLARTSGINPGFVQSLMLLLLALTIVISMQTVGVGLVAAMLVTPAASASLITRRLPTMMGVSALIGAISSIAGLFASYYLNVASGAAIVLTATVIFMILFFFSPRRGMVWARVRHARGRQTG